MHWPKVSRLKQEEMETLKHSIDVNRSLNRSAQSQIIKKRVGTNRSETRNKINDYSNQNITFTGLQNIKRDGNTSYTILQQPKKKMERKQNDSKTSS